MTLIKFFNQLLVLLKSRLFIYGSLSFTLLASYGGSFVQTETTFERQFGNLSNNLEEAKFPIDSLNALLQLSQLLFDYDSELGEKYSRLALAISEKNALADKGLHARLALAKYQMLNSELNESIANYLLILEHITNRTAGIKPKVLFELGQCYQLFGQHDLALTQFKASFEINRLQGDSVANALIESYISKSYLAIGELDKALRHAQKATASLQTLKSGLPKLIILNNQSTINLSLGRFSEAMNNVVTALSIADSLQNPRMQMEQLNDIGVIYGSQGDNANSLKYFEQALRMADSINSHRDYIGTLSNIAYINGVIGNHDKSLSNYREAITYNSQHGDRCMLPYIQHGMAQLYERLEQYDSMKVYFEQALTHSTYCQMKDFIVTGTLGMGRHSNATGDEAKALEYFHRAEKDVEDLEADPLIHLVYDQLYQAYKARQNYQRAMSYLEKAETLEDSLYNEQSQSEIKLLTIQYEFEKERNELENQKNLKDIQYAEDIKRQALTRNYLISGLLLSLLLGLILLTSYRDKLRSNRKLKHLNDEKNVLMGIVAHDLRNPLSSIKAILPLLVKDLKTSMSKDQLTFYQLARDSIDRMNEMIVKILDINAIESEVVNVDLRPNDLNEILLPVIKSFEQRAYSKGISLKYTPTEHELLTKTDKYYSMQVIENVLSNAIKFSDKSSEIRIESATKTNWVAVSIEDDGPGMTQDDQNKLFTRYAKLSAQPTGEEKSTGLGLSIVKKYMDVMNGLIEVESAPGKGTKFILKFPVGT